MSRPIYIDQDLEYPDLQQPADPYIDEAEAEMAGPRGRLATGCRPRLGASRV